MKLKPKVAERKIFLIFCVNFVLETKTCGK